MVHSVAQRFTQWIVTCVSYSGALVLMMDALHSQEMQYPLSVAVATDNSLYVADRLLPGIWKITEGKAKLFYQGDKKFRTPLNAVRTVAVSNEGRVFAGDSSTREIYSIDSNGKATPLTDGRIGIPVDIAIDAAGDLFVSDLETQRIWKVASGGGEPKEVVTLAAPRGLFVDKKDRLWAIAASGDQPLVRVGNDGTVEPVVRERIFHFPHDVVVGDDGTAFVSDNYARAIWKVTSDGKATQWISGDPLMGPVGLALHNDLVVIADPQSKAIFQCGRDGKPIRVASDVP